MASETIMKECECRCSLSVLVIRFENVRLLVEGDIQGSPAMSKTHGKAHTYH